MLYNMECFKSINGFSRYHISSNGEIINTLTNKYLKHMINKKGYHIVALYDKGKRYYKVVSRLVAEHFIPNRDNKPEVNHKDGNKDNNFYENLEWMTTKENIHHAMENGLRNRSLDCGRKRIMVEAFTFPLFHYLSTHSSISDAARFYNLSQGNIGEILKGNRKQTCGITFKILN